MSELRWATVGENCLGAAQAQAQVHSKKWGGPPPHLEGVKKYFSCFPRIVITNCFRRFTMAEAGV